MAIVLLLLLLFKTHTCEDGVQHFFEEINEVARKFNSIGADIAWKSSLDPGKPGLIEMATEFQRKNIFWKQKVCERLDHLLDDHTRKLNATQERQALLLCRGPNFTISEVREVSKIYEELQSIYSDVELCIPNVGHSDNITSIENAVLKLITDIEKYVIAEHKTIFFGVKKEGACFKGEIDFQNIMEHSRNAEVLEWFWLVWREKMRPMKKPYARLVHLENNAARRNGYSDIGASWREELEIPNLRQVSQRLYDSFKPLYVLLHGVVRFYLRREYGNVVPEKGPIPAYLLGDLWSQNWEPLADLILPKSIDLDQRLHHLNWTVTDMVKKAEDFYISLGLPPMTDIFWRESVFTRENHTKARCHGTAADMYKQGDVRLLYCANVSFKDFYVIHHEMGHIQYYMAYQNQPGLFRQANSFLQESIGDTIMQAVLTPQHLHRLRIINDSELFNTHPNKDINFIERIIKRGAEFLRLDVFDTRTESKEINDRGTFEDTDKITIDEILIFKQALNKIPQIPFAYIMDEYRYRYFEGTLDRNNLNEEFWVMSLNYQGISPPNERGSEYFDIGATFHVPDNTPYMRYFLSSFVQHQLFENLCKAAVFGHRNIKEPLPFSIHLNRCDIYGSKAAGKILKDIMCRGNSQPWQKILLDTIGEDTISSSALKRYYRPLYKILMKLVDKYNIPIGW